jgi:hypothetical protein
MPFADAHLMVRGHHWFLFNACESNSPHSSYCLLLSYSTFYPIPSEDCLIRAGDLFLKRTAHTHSYAVCVYVHIRMYTEQVTDIVCEFTRSKIDLLHAAAGNCWQRVDFCIPGKY